MKRILQYLTPRAPGNFFFRAQALALRCSSFLRSRKNKLPTALAEMDVLLAELHSKNIQLESGFLTAANSVMELDVRAVDFVTQGGQVVNVAVGRTGNTEVFAETMTVIAPPLEFLQASHAAIKKLLDRLKADNERIAKLIFGREDLQRTMAPLKYIQTSFKIESAPLGEEVQLMFTSLTQEIEKLHLQVCELFTTKYEELQRIQRTIGEVIGRLEAQTNGMSATITREKLQVDASLEQLQRELHANQQRESSLVGLSNEVAGEIKQIVSELPGQELICERLQRTVQSLTEVRNQYDGSKRGGELLEQVCRREADSIRAARTELARVEKSLTEGIEKVLGRLVESDQRCVSLQKFEQLTISASGMVQVLLDTLAMLKKQTAATVASCAGALEILRPIGCMASDLTLVVRDLSQRIHFIGLNAQMQAAQVPDGMGLEILSARTSEISRETNRISQSIAHQLDHLVAGLTESLSALELLHAAALAQQDALVERGAVAEQQLVALRTSALMAFTDVNSLLEGIRNQGQLVLVTTNYVATADATLGRLETQLTTVANLASLRISGRKPVTHFPVRPAVEIVST